MFCAYFTLHRIPSLVDVYGYHQTQGFDRPQQFQDTGAGCRINHYSTQEDHFKRTKHSLKNDCILLSSSDVFVNGYRQWLDKVGYGMPWYQGLATRSSNVDDHLANLPPSSPTLEPIHHRAGIIETRYHRHVMHCPTTRKALGRVKTLKKIMAALAVSSITLSCGMATSNHLPSHPCF